MPRRLASVPDIERPTTTRRGASPAAAALPEPVVAVVPVYRGREETIACLESVLLRSTAARLVVE